MMVSDNANHTGIAGAVNTICVYLRSSVDLHLHPTGIIREPYMLELVGQLKRYAPGLCIKVGNIKGGKMERAFLAIKIQCDAA